jgi:multisubunit Na+/H+ antiporter MnhB subunit
VEAMTWLVWGFDGLLGLILLWLAWLALNSEDLFKGIVLFVVFGLLMAIAWMRLEAPDVALAEVAIGAGLTGALLLAALAKLGVAEPVETTAPDEKERSHKQAVQWLPMAVILLLTTGLSYTMLSMPTDAPGLSAAVAANIESSGVSNPVTAVLLNFRGYDTLLEMVVLLLALLGVWSLGNTNQHRETATGPVLDTLTRLLIPLLILVTGYLLWAGAHAPGGAFQAGSVLGAAGVLLLLKGWHPRTTHITLPLRLLLVAGPGAFIIMALLTLMIEGQLLAFPPAQAGMLILLLETGATLSIGATLTALFLGKLHHGKRSE